MTAGPDQSDPNPATPAGAGRSTSSVPRASGLVLSPLRALRYDTAVAGDLSALTSPPYDVIDADGVAALEAASDYNVVRLILPRESTAAAQDSVARAARTLQDWRLAGVLVPDPVPALYVYEQAEPGGHTQRGLVGALRLSPPEDGIVLPHENTMTGPVRDRLALYTAVGADLEPIFLVYEGGGAATRAVASVDLPGPDDPRPDGPGPALLADAVLGDGLRHRLWAITDPAVLAEVAADLLPRRAVIADGHHRYATYLQRQSEHHRSYAAVDADDRYDHGLTLLVDASSFGPQVHAIHRYVPGRPVHELATLAAAGATVRRLTGDLDAALVALAGAGDSGPAFLLSSADGLELHLVTDLDPAGRAAAVPAGRSAAWAALDVSVLHSYVLALWTVPDDVEHVGYEHDVPGVLRAAGQSGGTAVLLNPTPISAVVAMAASGERMPRKSTLFTPKPRTGLVIRDLLDATSLP